MKTNNFVKTVKLFGSFNVAIILAKSNEDIPISDTSDFLKVEDVKGMSFVKGIEDKIYAGIVFNSEELDNIDLDTIVHECFHIYFLLLDAIGQEPMSAEELTQEIYAYTFGSFTHKVNKAFNYLKKIYQKGVDKKSKNKI